MNGINMKAFIVTDIILFDMNDKTLEPGKYYFLIKNFSENKSVIGEIIDDNSSPSLFEFRFFTFMTMIIKAQSYLAKRIDENSLSSTLVLKGEHMPVYDSPKKISKKRIDQINNFNSKVECLICLNETDNFDFNCKKLKCGHLYHKDCIQEWFQNNNNCPTCRQDF